MIAARAAAGLVLGTALLLYARRRGRTLLGVEGLVATFVLGTLLGVLVAAPVAAAFAFAIRRLPRRGSDG